MGVIFFIEKVMFDLKEVEVSNVSLGNVVFDFCIGGVFILMSQRKELLLGYEVDFL